MWAACHPSDPDRSPQPAGRSRPAASRGSARTSDSPSSPRQRARCPKLLAPGGRPSGGDGPDPATLAEREQPRRRCHALEPPASAQPRRRRAASTASIPCPHAAPPCLPRRALADGQPRRPGTCAGVWSTPGTGLWERLRSGRAADGGSHHPCHPCLVAGRASPCLYPVNPSLSRNHAAHTRKRPRVRAQWTRALWGLRAVPSRRPRVPRTSTRSWCGFLPRRGSRVWSELGTPGADVRQSPCCGSVTHQATRQGLSNTDVVGEFMKPLYLRQR